MKKLNLSLAILFFGIVANAQMISYGIKGGLLYNFKGSLTEIPGGVEEVYNDKGRGSAGWQIGGFAQIKLPLIYLQPELVFSRFSREYKIKEGDTFQSKISRLDMPVLVGTRVLDLVRLYGGPVVSVNLSNKVTLKEIKNYKSDDFNMGLQLGVGLDLLRFNFDLRWERGLTKSESSFVQKNTNSGFSVKNRPSMLLFSVGYKL